MGRCKRRDCKYRTTGNFAGLPGCNYSKITGHSRVAATAERLGLPYEEARQRGLTDPGRCPLYEGAKGKRAAERVQICLEPAGPRPKDKPRSVTGTLPPEERARRRAAYDRGLTAMEMARELGISASTVQWWLKREGLLPHVKTQGADWDLALQLYRSGASDSRIAKAIGRSSNAVWAWRQRNGLQAWTAADRAQAKAEGRK